MTYETLPRLIRAVAQSDPDRVFLQSVDDDSVVISYGDMHRLSLRWAAMYESVGVKAQDTVCILLPSSHQTIASWLGIAWLGAIEVPINIAYQGNLLIHMFEDSGAKVAVVSIRLIEQFRQVASQLTHLETVIVPDLDDSSDVADLPFSIWTASALDGVGEPVSAIEPRPRDLAAILYTSGTTGPSKGVMVTWAQLEETARTTLPYEPGEVVYNTYPLFHVSGKILGAYLPALAGGRTVIRESFKTSKFWSDIRTYGCTAANLLGAIPGFLLREPERPDDADNPLVKASMLPLVPEVEAMKKRFGFEVCTCFNMTEISCPLTSDGFNLANNRSVGRPREGYQVRLVDEEDREVPVGEVGELVVRADEPWVLNAGYWGRPEATVAAWRNLWFHTGDAFTRDADNNFYFVDRMKDAIRRRGENISSFEVEREVCEHPAVLECAAIGVPSDLGEDELKVVVVLKQGHHLEPAELYEFLRPRVAKFMLPRYITIVDQLPKTPTMKVRKVELRSWDQDESVWNSDSLR